MSVFFTRRGKPPSIKRASDYAVGESVFIPVNGVSKEFLVVNQGIPSKSSLYDSSCDGTWLLMKDIYVSKVWTSNNNNNYATSDINTYLNGAFLGLFDADTQSTIKQVKIPYYNSGVKSGANGLSTKIFLLGGYEFGWTTSNNSNFPVDGACLSYFSGLAATASKRKAYLNGTLTAQWLRSADVSVYNQVVRIKSSGAFEFIACGGMNGIRPALVIPFETKFDPDTNSIK